jgi:hypothetical protein
VESAPFSACVMTLMVSGGKDTFEKSFMPSNPVEFSRVLREVQPSPVVPSAQASVGAAHWIAGQAHGEPFTDCLTDCAALNAGDLNIKHHNFQTVIR